MEIEIGDTVYIVAGDDVNTALEIGRQAPTTHEAWDRLEAWLDENTE